MGAMKTLILPPDQWPLVEPIVTGEFGNGMPGPEQSTFLAKMSNEKLAGFIHIEHLFHFNCVYVAPEHRHSGFALQLIEEAAARIPRGFSAVWLTDRRTTQLAKSLGARDLGIWRIFRKDV